MRRKVAWLSVIATAGISLNLWACSSEPGSNDGSSGMSGSTSGGQTPTAGAAPAASGAIGQPSGGAGGRMGTGGGSGGALSLGGAGGASGQATSGGASGSNTTSAGAGGVAASGGAPAGGAPSGGASTAGGGAAGSGSGGVPTMTGGASGASGASGAPFAPPFILGADISSVQESNTMYRDTDGRTKSILEILKNHGFNYIRLKTFVDPSAPYGYSSTANGCAGLPETFGDRDHVVAFGKQIKAAGMGFLLNFHYSDVWADPGNQIIPEKWRNASSIADLASRMKAYTKDVLATAVAAGARPDMVQVGNEITPGMLMHVPGENTDCWGNNPESARVGGSTANWDNLATLLKAGIEGVREVDPRIQVMLHVENTDDLPGVKWWVDNARSRDVDFDVLGLSCYAAFQGEPSVWENTFESLAESYPELKFAIAEYNPERTEANRIMKRLPNGRGLGTFFWEPTRSGEWGDALFTTQGGVMVANTADFAEYDALRPELGL